MDRFIQNTPTTIAVKQKAVTVPSIIKATSFHVLRKTKRARIRQDWRAFISSLDANKGGKQALRMVTTFGGYTFCASLKALLKVAP